MSGGRERVNGELRIRLEIINVVTVGRPRSQRYLQDKENETAEIVVVKLLERDGLILFLHRRERLSILGGSSQSVSRIWHTKTVSGQ